MFSKYSWKSSLVNIPLFESRFQIHLRLAACVFKWEGNSHAWIRCKCLRIDFVHTKYRKVVVKNVLFITEGVNRGMQIRRSIMIYWPNPPLKFCLHPKSGQKHFYYPQSPKSGPKKWLNLQSAEITGSGNPLKSRFESEIRAKIFSKSADPFTYSPPLLRMQIWLCNRLRHARQRLTDSKDLFMVFPWRYQNSN